MTYSSDSLDRGISTMDMTAAIQPSPIPFFKHTYVADILSVVPNPDQYVT